MACMKCGSAWVTRKGKDMVSCPECCKQQRCKARKQGRLPPSVQKACKRCGNAFEVFGCAISHRLYCEDCDAFAKADRRQKKRDCNRACYARINRGEHVRTPRSRKEKLCQWCSKHITGRTNCTKYCSPQCFREARNAGVQSWDRTRQIESIWHRGGRWACAPSRKPVREIRTAFTSFLSKVRALIVRASTPTSVCKVCGVEVGRDRKGFCSPDCVQRYEEPMPCRKCGQQAIAKAGRKSATCDECKRKANAEANRRAKQRYGRNHRQRARHHGVKYVAFPVRSIYERDGYKCQLCRGQVLPKAAYRKRDGKIHPRSPTIDHIVPMCKGGNHEPVNCQTACFSCNTKKGAAAGGQLRLSIG